MEAASGLSGRIAHGPGARNGNLAPTPPDRPRAGLPCSPRGLLQGRIEPVAATVGEDRLMDSAASNTGFDMALTPAIVSDDGSRASSACTRTHSRVDQARFSP